MQKNTPTVKDQGGLLLGKNFQVEAHPRPKRDWTQSHRYHPSSIRWKILVIALVTTIAFSAYLTFDLLQSNTQASLLKDIRDKHYPTLASLQEASFVLRFIQSKMEDAVITGDLDTLEETADLRQQFLDSIQSVERTEYDRKDFTENIVMTFNYYYDTSYRLAEQLLVGEVDINDSALKGQEIAALYLVTVGEVDVVKEKELARFNDAVSLVTRRADWIVEIGVPVGLVTMILVFFLASITSRQIISRVNHMIRTLRDVAEDDGDLSVRISVPGRDEMSELAYWFNQFIGELEKVTKESTEEIRRLAFTDTLTQLPNRRLFDVHLKSSIRLSHHQEKKLAVMFLDLDNFKAVNDQLGHDAGDALVREVGERLVRTVRGNDFVAYDDESLELYERNLVARMGGDEFMLLITDLEEVAFAEAVAERVRKSILEPIVIYDTECKVGVSIGIAIYPDNGHSAEELVINADLAMYEAKNRGKNNYCLFNDELENEAKLNLKIESALRKALQADELELYYQPKFDIQRKTMVGAEALLRWRDPHLGQMSPAKFIPLAEQSGLIYDIDSWVIHHSCQQCRQWIDSGFDLVPIAINISAKQAARIDLIEKIKTALEAANLPPHSIEIEITETSALLDLEIVAENVRAIKDLQVTVAIDDFGAGHSSLSLLKYCSIDTLKIDRGFLAKFHDNEHKPIYKAVLALAKVLGMLTVAEGVEQESELASLRKMGCDVGQGFLFAVPMNAGEFEARMTKSQNNNTTRMTATEHRLTK